MLSETHLLHTKTLGTQKCASTLSMELCRVIFVYSRRGNFDSKLYLTSWYMGCFIESITMVFYSGS